LSGRLYKASLDKYEKVADKYKRKASDFGLDAKKYSGYITDYSDEEVKELQKEYSVYDRTTGYNPKPLSKDENRDIRNSIRTYRDNVQNLINGNMAAPTNSGINNGQQEQQEQQQNNRSSMNLNDFRQQHGY
jgi:hypothetical protein